MKRNAVWGAVWLVGLTGFWLCGPAVAGQNGSGGATPFVPETEAEPAPMPDTCYEPAKSADDSAAKIAAESIAGDSWTDDALCGTTFEGCCLCGPPGQYWFRADYLVWWAKGTRVPALFATSDPANAPQPGTEAFARKGSLADPDVDVVFGGRIANRGARQGYRLQFGYWFDECRVRGIQADYFDIGGFSDNYDSSVGPNANPPLLTRPFTDVTPGSPVAGPNSEKVTYPGVSEGRAVGSIRDSFESAGAALRLNMVCCGPCCASNDCCTYMANAAAGTTDCFRLDMIAGYRYYQLGDSVIVREELSLLGAAFQIEDAFRALNDYHGGELGLVMQWYRGRWSFEGLAKMALGNNHQTVWINGSTLRTIGAQTDTASAGILALDTNIGQYDRDSFVVIPQFGVEVGYQLTCHLRAFLGYNFLYWAHVTRAADAIDTSINTNWVPGASGWPVGGPPNPVPNDPAVRNPERPAYNTAAKPWAQTDYWAQGINVGLELRY